MALPPIARLAWGGLYTLGMCQKAMFEQATGASSIRVRDLGRQWAEGMTKRMGVEVRAFGFDTVDWSVPRVIMANHQSYLDVLALYRAMGRPFGFIAKRQLFAIPFFGGVMRAFGCVPVDRAKRVEAIGVMRKAAEEVRSGSIIAVFPEGTRSAGDRVAPLKKGPFYLVEVAQVSIVPIGIRGTAALMPRRNTGIRPGVVEVHVGAPIDPIGPGNAKRNAMAGRVREELSRLSGLPMLD
jgi:1-acyl-sn-glycerol-3-phosphate acyltransferase